MPSGYDLGTLVMPRGPRGERRPADVVGCAVHVAKIATATGEIEDTRYKQPNKVKAGQAGAEARTAVLLPENRSEIARKAAESRWAAKRSDV